MSYPEVRTVTIESSASLSEAIDLRDKEVEAILMPAAWTTAGVTFQAAESFGGTYRDVYDDTGTEVNVSAAVSRAIPIGTATKRLRGIQFLKVRSGTSGAAVVQLADRTITLLVRARV